MRYPVILTPDDNGTVLMQARDIPGVMSTGANEADALVMGLDALLTVFDWYMSEGRPIPAPSDEPDDRLHIVVPALATVKLAIYEAMRDQGISRVRLAALLQTSPKAVRRLLDLWHCSRWDQLERAMAVLGLKAVVDVRKAA